MQGSLTFTRLNTPNARFVHIESFGFPNDLDYQIQNLKKLIDQQPQIQQANPFCSIFFFFNPNDEDFDDLEALVGLEIIGHLELDESDPFHLIDLDRSHCYSFDLNPQTLKKELGQFYQKALQVLINKGERVATTWRLRFSLEDSDQFLAFQNLRLEFFPDEGPIEGLPNS